MHKFTAIYYLLRDAWKTIGVWAPRTSLLVRHVVIRLDNDRGLEMHGDSEFRCKRHPREAFAVINIASSLQISCRWTR